MNRIRPRIPILAAGLALAAGIGLALAVPAGADVSTQSAPVAALQLGSTAVLDARGAVITVPVTVVCTPGASGFLSIQITQRVGSETTHGSAWAGVNNCTGAFQTINLTVSATGKAFRKGTAFGSASFGVCDGNGCSQATDQHDITLVNKE